MTQWVAWGCSVCYSGKDNQIGTRYPGREKSMLCVPIHSITDLITNSSTTIYTYSEGSEEACRNLIDEVFRVCGVDKKCDDVFTLYVGVRNYELDCLDGLKCELPPELQTDPDDWMEKQKYLDRILADVRSRVIDEPEWLTKLAERMTRCGEYSPDTRLFITPKDPKYEPLANLISKFLYSTTHDGSFDG